MSIHPVLHWLFGPHMFDVGAILCVGVGLALASSTDQKDIPAASGSSVSRQYWRLAGRLIAS